MNRKIRILMDNCTVLRFTFLMPDLEYFHSYEVELAISSIFS